MDDLRQKKRYSAQRSATIYQIGRRIQCAHRRMYANSDAAAAGAGTGEGFLLERIVLRHGVPETWSEKVDADGV